MVLWGPAHPFRFGPCVLQIMTHCPGANCPRDGLLSAVWKAWRATSRSLSICLKLVELISCSSCTADAWEGIPSSLRMDPGSLLCLPNTMSSGYTLDGYSGYFWLGCIDWVPVAGLYNFEYWVQDLFSSACVGGNHRDVQSFRSANGFRAGGFTANAKTLIKFGKLLAVELGARIDFELLRCPCPVHPVLAEKSNDVTGRMWWCDKSYMEMGSSI